MRLAIKVVGEQSGGFDSAIAQRGIVVVIVVNNDGLKTKDFALLLSTQNSLHVRSGGSVAENDCHEPDGGNGVAVDQKLWNDAGVFHNEY